MDMLKVIKCELRIRQKRNSTAWEVLTVTMYSDGSVTRTILCERGTEEEARSVISRSGYSDRYSTFPDARVQKSEVVPEDIISCCNDSEDTRPGQKREAVSNNIVSAYRHSGILTPDQELRYLELIDRITFLSSQSGILWRPEYTQELDAIDQEIDALHTVIYSSDQARKPPLSNT